MRFFFMYHHLPFIYVNQNYLLIFLDVFSPTEFHFLYNKIISVLLTTCLQEQQPVLKPC